MSHPYSEYRVSSGVRIGRKTVVKTESRDLTGPHIRSVTPTFVGDLVELKISKHDLIHCPSD